MKKFSFIVIMLWAVTGMKSQNNPETYRLFDSDGQVVDYQQMIGDLAQQDVVFFGEIHNCPIVHWLEYKVLESLYDKQADGLSVGMEMFEADNQLLVDEYMNRQISASQFEEECRLWPNYETDYKSVVDFVREKHLRLVATNVPRRYAGMVKNQGLACLDSVSDEAKKYMPELPIPYESNPQANEAFGMMTLMGKNKDVNLEYMGEAQGLKDATMAWFIAKNLKRHLIHFNGNYHSDSGDGIVKYLRHYRPDVRIKTIYSVRQDEIEKLDSIYLGHGDYYICVPEDMVTSY